VLELKRDLRARKYNSNIKTNPKQHLFLLSSSLSLSLSLSLFFCSAVAK
jgi:hypothetical protein